MGVERGVATRWAEMVWPMMIASEVSLYNYVVMSFEIFEWTVCIYIYIYVPGTSP